MPVSRLHWCTLTSSLPLLAFFSQNAPTALLSRRPCSLTTALQYVIACAQNTFSTKWDAFIPRRHRNQLVAYIIRHLIHETPWCWLGETMEYNTGVMFQEHDLETGEFGLVMVVQWSVTPEWGSWSPVDGQGAERRFARFDVTSIVSELENKHRREKRAAEIKWKGKMRRCRRTIKSWCRKKDGKRVRIATIVEIYNYYS